MRTLQRSRGVWLALTLGALAAPGALGCGSEQSKMERGVVVDREVAVPDSQKELDMTQTERKKREEREVEQKETNEFDESEER